MKPFIFAPEEWVVIGFVFLGLSIITYGVIHECKKLIIAAMRQLARGRSNG